LSYSYYFTPENKEFEKKLLKLCGLTASFKKALKLKMIGFKIKQIEEIKN
jgi:hypothetical protein